MLYDNTKGKCEAEDKTRCRFHGTKMGDFLPPYEETKNKVQDLQMRLWTATGAQRREMQAQLDAAVLDMDASDEGLKELLYHSLEDRNAPGINPFRFADEERISNAEAHRAQKRTEVAIAEYRAAHNHNVLRLFDDSGVTPEETPSGLIAIKDAADPLGRSVVFDPASTNFDEDVIRLRERVGTYQADSARYNARRLLADIDNSSLVLNNAPGQKAIYYVTDKRSNEVIAEVTLGRNNVFKQARIASPHTEGAVSTFSAAPQLRVHLAHARSYTDTKPLPAWVMGASVKQAAPAAESASAPADALF